MNIFPSQKKKKKKDLQRHAFSEVTVAAPLPAKTPAVPLGMSSEDG